MPNICSIAPRCNDSVETTIALSILCLSFVIWPLGMGSIIADDAVAGKSPPRIHSECSSAFIETNEYQFSHFQLLSVAEHSFVERGDYQAILICPHGSNASGMCFRFLWHESEILMRS